MPLPKKLPKSAGKDKKKKAMGDTMHDLKHGPHHKDRTHKQEIAIAMKQSGQSKEGKHDGAAEDKKKAVKTTADSPAKAQRRSEKDANRKKRNKGRG